MTHILTREQSIELKKTWKKHLEQKSVGWRQSGHAGWHHLLYAMMRGKDVSKAFTPAKTERRIRINEEQGLGKNAGLQIAYSRAHSALTYAIYLAKKQENGQGVLCLEPADTKIPLGIEEMENLQSQLAEVKKLI